MIIVGSQLIALPLTVPMSPLKRLSTSPVSYTHLDVYKRQELNNWISARQLLFSLGLAIFFACSTNFSLSISTFLSQDVYKRQVPQYLSLSDHPQFLLHLLAQKPVHQMCIRDRTDGVLTIQGNDPVSGITAVTVNGTTYTDLKDGMLRVQLLSLIHI